MHSSFHVSIPQTLNERALLHLIREDGQEDLTFALWNPSIGNGRLTSLICELILPNEKDRQVHGNVSFEARYFKRSCQIATQKRMGLCLMHSHPGSGWQDMSPDDIKAESKLAGTSFTLTDLPLVGLTVGSDGTWSGRIWQLNKFKFERKWAETVKVVGKHLRFSFNERHFARPRFRKEFMRTRTVYGKDDHERLTVLRYGIVGLGSVGSVVAEQLARMGVLNITLIDFDKIKAHNLDRTLGATKRDIGKLKVDVVKRQIISNGTGEKIDVKTFPISLSEPVGYKAALDCDILFSCVDRPLPRHVLNHIAYAHLIPVIDGGIRVAFSGAEGFDGADWQVQTVGPSRPCLQCLKTYEPADVSLELTGMLENPAYMDGLPNFHPLKNNQNIIAFSCNLASLEIFHLMALVTRVGGAFTEFGVQRFRYKYGYISNYDDKKCYSGCTSEELTATGDTVISWLG